MRAVKIEQGTFVSAAALLLALCGCGSSSAPPADAGSDAGPDSGPVDSGPSWSAPVST